MTNGCFQRLSLLAVTILTLHLRLASMQQSCLSNCGTISIRYPWGLDYGCGDPSFHGLLVCKTGTGSASELDLLIPSGSYQVQTLDYSNQTIAIADSSLWDCSYVSPGPNRNFTLPASKQTPLQLSSTNHFLFLGCAANASISSKYSPCINNSALCATYLSGCHTSIYLPGCCEHDAEAYDSIDVSTLQCIYTSFYGDVLPSEPKDWSFGFQLKFVQNDSRAAACKLCVTSGGQCGYNSTHPFLCICNEGNSTTDCSADCGRACVTSNANQKSIIAGVVIATIAITFFSLMACYWWCWRSRAANQYLRPLKGMNDSPIQFTLKELTEATDNFREKLGSGGYASVYKGILVNGSIVAVKKLSALRQAAKVFRAEVSTLGSINHFNLVKLIGYCSDNSERLLVYEYMSNGSLDRFIFNPSADVFLDWNKRFEIALGAARGIAYLHEGARTRIMHCDIKPANILLDDNFTAKVADFGLAKLIKEREQNQMHSAAIKGTLGYIAPECFKGPLTPVTEKSDVYSFGMVLLELFGGRKNVASAPQSNSSHFLLSAWATEAAQRNDFKAILDPRLINGGVDDDQAARFIGVSILCIQNDPVLRPCMNDVVKMLEGSMQVTQPLPLLTATPYEKKVKNIWENAGNDYTLGGILDSHDNVVSAR